MLGKQQATAAGFDSMAVDGVFAVRRVMSVALFW
jgi:hypothetical protein